MSESSPSSQPDRTRPETLLGWVGWEYDDGIQSVHYSTPDEYHDTLRAVPADLLARYEAAREAEREAGKALLDAWAAAAEVPNPNYRGFDD